jgi:hypothetical protein
MSPEAAAAEHNLWSSASNCAAEEHYDGNGAVRRD